MTKASLLMALLAAAPEPRGGMSAADLVAAARASPVSLVDYGEDHCDLRTVAAWLSALTAGQARAVRWTGGPCRIVGPGKDAGSRWCAQATITLRRPLSREDRPMVEIFFETPSGGRPGPAYAFRGAMIATDGADTMRFRKDFEAAWVARFPEAARAVIACPAAAVE